MCAKWALHRALLQLTGDQNKRARVFLGLRARISYTHTLAIAISPVLSLARRRNRDTDQSERDKLVAVVAQIQRSLAMLARAQVVDSRPPSLTYATKTTLSSVFSPSFSLSLSRPTYYLPRVHDDVSKNHLPALPRGLQFSLSRSISAALVDSLYRIYPLSLLRRSACVLERSV